MYTLHYVAFFVVGMLAYAWNLHGGFIALGIFVDFQFAAVVMIAHRVGPELDDVSPFDPLLGLPTALGAAAMHAVCLMLSG
jgi:hypothetical protein